MVIDAQTAVGFASRARGAPPKLKTGVLYFTVDKAGQIENVSQSAGDLERLILSWKVAQQWRRIALLPYSVER